MNKYMAVIEYDGTGFNGFQTQPEGNRTVQKELTSVLSNILNREIIMGCAGRTDAGVHARGQVIDFTTEKDLDLYRIKWSLNNLLPGDISVKEIKKVKDGFDSRRDARWREYTYNVVNADYHSVFLKKYSILITRKLDIKSMGKAAGMFVGKRDFSPFASPSIREEFNIREIYEFFLEVKNGGLLEFRIRANSFLYNMVRIMIGTILEVGKGERTISEIIQALETGEGNFSSSMAPAKGLFLNRVEYDI